MLKYDIILLDLDGTITLSEPGIVRSVEYALRETGRPPLSPERLKSFVGPPLFESFMRESGMDEAAAQLAVNKYRERFSLIGWRENLVYRGIPHLLKALRRSGAYIALATAKPQIYAERIIAHFGLSRVFDAIVGPSMTENHADKAVLIAAAMSGARPGRAVMIGDRANDIQGAHARGIDSIGVSYGFAPEGELEAARPTHIAASVDELSSILLSGGLSGEPGRFITFEGMDGSGKTSQMRAAAEYIGSCGYNVVMTREPGGSPIAEKVRGVLLDPDNEDMSPECEAYLFAASRADHVTTVIKPAMARGDIVLCDRYVDSSAAYQGGGRGLGIEKVMELNRFAVDGCAPDLTLLFDLSPLEAAARRRAAGKLDRMEQVGPEFNQRVYEAFIELAENNRERIVKIDASRAPEEVGTQAEEHIRRLIEL